MSTLCSKEYTLTVDGDSSCAQQVQDIGAWDVILQTVWPGEEASGSMNDGSGTVHVVGVWSDDCGPSGGSVQFDCELCNDDGPAYDITIHRSVTRSGAVDCINSLFATIHPTVEIYVMKDFVIVPGSQIFIATTDPNPYSDDITVTIPQGATTHIRLMTAAGGEITADATYTITPLVHP